MQGSTKIWTLYSRLLKIATDEYGSIIESGEIFHSSLTNNALKLRLYLYEESFIDIYYSQKGRYSYHWNRLLTHNEIYRYDNAPHIKWKSIQTFPKHFHNGSEENVVSSELSDNPEEALREFLDFVSNKLK
ncbi:MAG: hypothetical protein OHK0032_02980 [Thermodesulfovibrionales bacterium]